MHEKDIIVGDLPRHHRHPPLLAHVDVPAVMPLADDLGVAGARRKVELDLIADTPLNFEEWDAIDILDLENLLVLPLRAVPNAPRALACAAPLSAPFTPRVPPHHAYHLPQRRKMSEVPTGVQPAHTHTQ